MNRFFPYQDDLNSRQQEAVCFGKGPILVLAGAGSGKTRVLTHRIVHLIFSGTALEENILALTFTNKAAGEMRQRVQDLLRKGRLSCHISTFHSFCARVLRRHIDVLGQWNRQFTIYDRGDQKSLIRSVLKQLNLPRETYPVPMVLSILSSLKKKEMGPQEFMEENPQDPLADIYHHYILACIENNGLDFDDLIFLTLQIFHRFPKILEGYQHLFQYIMVDEFQDCSPSQYQLIRMLGAPQFNILGVGDDDQSIYGFRGVEPHIFEHFTGDFPHRHLVKLEENYRSTQIILTAANHVIAKNSRREEKKLWTRLGEGEKILLQATGNEREEAGLIVSYIKQIAATQKGYNEIALLYRANAQSRSLEETLKLSGIPYLIVGGTRFYERKEIKDILAYLNLVVNPQDEISFRRVINFPSRGIGAKTIAFLEKEARRLNTSLFKALNMLVRREPNSSSTKKFIPFARIFSDLPDGSSVSEITGEIVSRTGIRRYYESDTSPESQARLDNIDEFFSATKDFDRNEAEVNISLFLEQVRLISDADAVQESGAVTLMTVHCAKGLEFPVVIVVGMEDGIFPIIQSFGNPEQSEEERRLFYVAMTRAKKQLVLTRCRQRTIYGKTIPYPPSRFLGDIPDTLLKHDNQISASPFTTNRLHPEQKQIKNPEIPPPHTFDEKYKTGRGVFHPIWGNGRIYKVEGQGVEMILICDFSIGRKKLKAKYAHLGVCRT